MTTKKKNTITTKELDEKFESGDDISEYLDEAKAVRRINLDIPEAIIRLLDKEADRIGITRQALIKVWITDRLDHLTSRKVG